MAQKARPKSYRGLVQALNRGQALDGRTNIAKSIKDVRSAIQEDLTDAARALLEHDASTAAVVQSIALKHAFSDLNNVVKPDGKACQSLGTWSKFAAIKRTSLLALKKFEQIEAEEERPKTLADIVIDADTEPSQPDVATVTNGHRPEPKDDWRRGLRHGEARSNDFQLGTRKAEDH